MANSSERTEKATPRRLQKARADGRFLSSREFLSAAHFLAAVTLLGFLGPRWLVAMQDAVRAALRVAFEPERADGPDVLRNLLIQTTLSFAGAAAVLTGLTLAMQLMLTRAGFSGKRLLPDLNRLNPASRLKSLPRQSLAAAVQAAVLIPVTGALIWVIARDNLTTLMALPFSDLRWGTRQVAGALKELLWKAGGLLLLFGVVDLFRQARTYGRDLRMSKQELREEMKETEGNSQIKGRIRRLQRDAVRRQMLRAVPSATAIIVNPTHYSVAIRYHLDEMSSPVVLAKGKNFLAKRIREVAIDHEIPIFEQPLLARALYQTVEVGQEIPSHFYRAVAEILAFVYRRMGAAAAR